MIGVCRPVNVICVSIEHIPAQGVVRACVKVNRVTASVV